MNDPIDMLKFVAELPKRRARAAVVLSRDFSGQKAWAAELASRTGAEHIDVLELFSADADLGARVGVFMVDDLFKLLRNRAQTPVLIVSGLEFLFAVWTGQAKAVEKFASQLELWQDRPSLLFVMQHERGLAERKFTRFPSLDFVVDQSNTLALL
jgi:hypothetical protein